ncbi:hypothetical protein [Alienimonas californiensis]|uniref:Uncharacterized protein n=1 Tax=Alienimonas californiensis TaxID=2527989 RepID=A0A517P780_9PLAN|nr:hypothetical protein [Alienimonas californiensis]QDT15220.1 hypothetical protein CA12_13020 [Alienimonas californiensis]
MLQFLPPLAADPMRLLWALPTAAAISLVYTASRYEDVPTIWRRSAGMFGKTLLFLAAVFAALYLLSFNL